MLTSLITAHPPHRNPTTALCDNFTIFNANNHVAASIIYYNLNNTNFDEIIFHSLPYISMCQIFLTSFIFSGIRKMLGGHIIMKSSIVSNKIPDLWKLVDNPGNSRNFKGSLEPEISRKP